MSGFGTSKWHHLGLQDPWPVFPATAASEVSMSPAGVAGGLGWWLLQWKQSVS